MSIFKEIYANWNPWHGCTKISAGCRYCYVYRQDEMYGSEKSSSVVTKNTDFNLPLRRKRDKSYKIASGMVVFTCFTSDFLVEGADKWRSDVWAMIRERSDCMFYFLQRE
jgi:protein gp37